MNKLNYIFFSLQEEQIQTEYKVLALQHHPDKNDGDKEAEAKFQLLKVSTATRASATYLSRVSIDSTF